MLGSGRVRVLVQGITGREGSYWTERMRGYGTEIVAGVTPGKGGHSVHGIPVYDSVEATCANHAVDASVLFVPSAAVKSAACETIHCGIKRLVILAEHVPVQDVMEVLAVASDRGVQVIGPNCPGVVVPGRYFIGIMPAWAKGIFQPGTVGVVSRSGSLGTLICLNLVRAGLGQSAFMGIGGDPIVGTTFLDALQMLQMDPGSRAIVMVGEVGGTTEEDAAAFIPKMTKPVVAFIAGKSAPEGKRMGHAGAIVSGGRGSAGAKTEALRRAGAYIADVPSRISEILPGLLAGAKG
ncbi:MAG: succinate--CoA ligase subunit alpha [Candidatus Methylomirabilales bacterium]